MNSLRAARAARDSIARLKLDLSGLTVYTEAATGPYAVTPVLAAAAGARKVFAIARDNRYGSASDAIAQCRDLATFFNADASVIIYEIEKRPQSLSEADILTNSGNIRPIDRSTIASLKPLAVIPLMYESWELRPDDIDIAACRAAGIPVAGTNECHADIGFFEYLGPMALKLMLDASFEIHGTTVSLLCDNSFSPFLSAALRGAGATVRLFGAAGDAGVKPLSKSVAADFRGSDAILVASSPLGEPVILGSAAAGALLDIAEIAKESPGIELFEFCWGGAVDRAAAAGSACKIHPASAPPKGHMGVIPSMIGPVPLVWLQAGGLKVGEVLARARLSGRSAEEAVAAAAQSGYGTAIA